jgi:nucleotide-binding universal stress UspA family protein
MERPNRYSTIIVALDGSRKTERILGPARDLAKLYGATVVLVRALDRDVLPPESDARSGPSVAVGAGPMADNVSGLQAPAIGAHPGEGITPARPIENPEAAGYLNVIDHELEADGLQVEHVDPDDGDPAEAIVQVARSRDASLIVMGTHQRRGLDRLFRGSVAEKVLRESPCPVLAIPLE